MIVTNPQFPSREGMVEDIDANGNRFLKPTVEFLDKAKKEALLQSMKSENAMLKAQLKATSESNAFLEECLVEMAEIVYA